MVAQVQGYLVHVYTASALLFVVLAAQWILDGRYELALLAMAVTIVIDATDGGLARKYRTKDTAPGIDGALLDNIVDFLAYAFLPMLFLLRTELLLEPRTLFVTFVMFASAYGFSRTTAKLADRGFFVGFPSYWNVVVFYLFLLEATPPVATAIVVVLALLVFIPLRFLYVSRLRASRTLHIVLGGLWGLACLLALLVGPGPWRRGLLLASLLYVVFYALHSFVLDYRDRRRGR